MEILSNITKKKLLSTLEPTKQEREKIDLSVEEFISKINFIIVEKNLDIKILTGGSYAKGTYIKSDFDVDIFFQFSNSYEKISDSIKSNYIVEIISELKIPFQIEQGSRVYVSGNYFSLSQNYSFSFECVPTQFVKDVNLATNSTDISIYHVGYLKNKIDENRDLANEIRIAKMWFKSNQLYGAESYINGFSGHSIECLIIHFGTFEKLILFLANMSEGEIINLDVTWEISKISKDKISPLIIKDPIVVGRNALSALSKQMFYESKFKAQLSTLNSISLEDFQIKTFKSLSELKKDFFKNKKYGIKIEFKFNTDSIQSKDIIGSKSKKIFEKIIREISFHNFEVLNSSFAYNYNFHVFLGFIELKSFELSSKYYFKGPKLSLGNNIIVSFLNSHKNEDVVIKQDFIYILKYRKIRNISRLIKNYDSKENIEKLFLSKSFEDLKKVKINLLN